MSRTTIKEGLKSTEGVGYISGDHECWCINPVPFEMMNFSDEDTWLELDEKRVYPSAFIPQIVKIWKDKLGREPKVKWKVKFSVEILENNISEDEDIVHSINRKEENKVD